MLSREQKLEAYKYVIYELEGERSRDDINGGICRHLLRWIRIKSSDMEIFVADLRNYTPELCQRIDVSQFVYELNYEGHTKRIELLKEIVETLEKQC